VNMAGGCVVSFPSLSTYSAISSSGRDLGVHGITLEILGRI